MDNQQDHSTDFQSLLHTASGLPSEQQCQLVQSLLTPDQYTIIEAAALSLSSQDRSRLIKALMISQAQLPQSQMETAVALDKRILGGR